jgi:hypothetical protein
MRTPARHRFPPALSAVTLLLPLAFFLVSCQTTDPPPAEQVLRLKLNDSLKNYERVVVQVLDRQDTNRVLVTLWDDALPSPATQVKPYSLLGQTNPSFIVKVTGYKAKGQLALETMIFYDGGKKTVLHQWVPPLQTLDRLKQLTPSSGTMSPPFNKDSLNYLVTIPEGIASITFGLIAEDDEAVIRFAGDTVRSGTASKPRAVGTVLDTVTVLVTSSATGTASTKMYTLILRPTKPAELFVASMTPSVGILTPAFSPEITVYSLRLPTDIDTVSFRLYPADPKTMQMTFQGTAIFPGEKSFLFTLQPGGSDVATFEVVRGAGRKYYQVTIDRPLP